MRSLLILLSLVCSTASAGDWWKKSEHSLPDLFNMGYEIIGFTVAHQPHNGMLNSVEQDVYRYMLKRPTAPGVMLCVEREDSRGKTKGSCYSAR